MSSAAMISRLPSVAAKARTLRMLSSQLKIGLCAISGWMAAASYPVYFSAPIQAITTTSAYLTRYRPTVATGCSVVTAVVAGDCLIWSMADSFRMGASGC